MINEMFHRPHTYGKPADVLFLTDLYCYLEEMCKATGITLDQAIAIHALHEQKRSNDLMTSKNENECVVLINESGRKKSTIPLKIAAKYKQDEVVWLSDVNKEGAKKRYLFADCTENTKLIIVEDLDAKTLREFIEIVNTQPVTVVDKKHHAPFEINPKFILAYNR